MNLDESNNTNDNKNCIIWGKDIDYYMLDGTILYSKLPDSYRMIVDKDNKEEDIEDEYYNDLIIIEGNKSENNNKPTVIEANMTIKDNKIEENNKNIDKSNHDSYNTTTTNTDKITDNTLDKSIQDNSDKQNNSTITNSTIDNSTNINNSYNTNIENKYTCNNVYNIMANIPDRKLSHDYRDMLDEIYRETNELNHIFTGFINFKNNNKIVICNLMWKKRIYVCNHINIFEGDFDNLQVGDFIRFKGRIMYYTRKKSGVPDIGLKMLSVSHLIRCDENIRFVGCDKNVVYNPSKNRFLDRLTHNELALFYEKQLTNIKFCIERSGLYTVDMYLSIIQTVYFEGTKEYEMYRNRLDVDDCDITPDYVKYVSLVRYLICECNINHPFIIYTILCMITNNRKLNSNFYYIKKCSADNLMYLNMTSNDITDMIFKYNVYLNIYINEFREETDVEAPSWRLDN